MSKLNNDQSGKITFMAMTYVLLLFILSSTMMVLSLIPVYLPEKSITISVDARRSNTVTMYLDTGISLSSRRKRQASRSPSFVNCIGCLFPVDKLGKTLQTLNRIVQENENVNEATLEEAETGTTTITEAKLFSPKLQSVVFIVMVKFRIKYKQKCDYLCQDRVGAKIQTSLETQASLFNFYLTDVPLYTSNGEFWGIADSIPIVRLLYVSPIGSASTATSSILTIVTDTTTDTSTTVTDTTTDTSTTVTDSTTDASTTVTDTTTDTSTTVTDTTTDTSTTVTDTTTDTSTTVTDTTTDTSTTVTDTTTDASTTVTDTTTDISTTVTDTTTDISTTVTDTTTDTSITVTDTTADISTTVTDTQQSNG